MIQNAIKDTFRQAIIQGQWTAEATHKYLIILQHFSRYQHYFVHFKQLQWIIFSENFSSKLKCHAFFTNYIIVGILHKYLVKDKYCLQILS